MRNFIKSFIKGVTIGVGLTFGLLTVFAAIVWPTTPTGEVDGGAFMNYFAKVMVNTGTTTNGVAKKAQSLGLESGDTTVVSLNGANVGIGTTTAAQKLEVQGNLKVNGAIIDGTGTRMDSNGGWIRTYGPTGWYNNTYGGGWNMTDATRIRTYGSKSIYQNAGTLRTDGTLSVGVETSPLLYASNILGKVGIGTNNPTAKLEVNGNIVAANPTANNHLATKEYVDSVVAAAGSSYPVQKRLFITSTLYNGNLGGISGANAKCQARADAASLGGTWKALLSLSTRSQKYALGNDFDYLVDLDGTVISDKPHIWIPQYYDGAGNAVWLLHSIANTEFNGAPYSVYWTGRDNAGSMAYDCNGWTDSTSTYSGGYGQANITTSTWYYYNKTYCSQSLPLLCVEA